MAEGGPQNQQQTVFNINIYSAQNQREIIQTRNTATTNKVVAKHIGLVNIQQAAAQQDAQNVGQQPEADNVPPDNIAEGVDALNLSTRNPEVKKSDENKRKGDFRDQHILLKSTKDKSTRRKRRAPPPPPSTSACRICAGRGNNSLKISILRKKSIKLFDESNYEEAVPILEELATLQNHQDLDTVLPMIECFIHLGRRNEAETAIGNLRDISMTSSITSADDVEAFATDLISNSAHISAIILLQIASDMYKARVTSPDDAINRIRLCINKMYQAIKPMIEVGGRSKTIALDYGIEYMTEMLDDIRVIENADPVNKALSESSCLQFIGSIYTLADEYEKSITLFISGLGVLDQQFRSNASKYQIYGLSLHNIGLNHHDLQEYKEADYYYIKAIEAYKNATDYENEADRKKDIELVDTDQKNTRARKLTLISTHIRTGKS
uniref:uncharacterized protein LOC120326621 n=1 Tax=Styela clava TaxID=7725 RepID=UPI00193A9277|nr:uncharacterized protein LOC120326621 [Styela clava]